MPTLVTWMNNERVGELTKLPTGAKFLSIYTGGRKLSADAIL